MANPARNSRARSSRTTSLGYRQRSAGSRTGSAGWSAANSAFNVTEKAAAGLFRWMVTDHSRFGSGSSTLFSLLSFTEKIRYIIVHSCIQLAGIVLTCAWIFFLIAYGIPYLLSH